MQHLSDTEYRRRLIARVEALRLDAWITKLAFHQQIGPVASAFWKRFETESEEAVWQHFSLKGISRIGDLFDVGVELLQFSPRRDPCADQVVKRH